MSCWSIRHPFVVAFVTVSILLESAPSRAEEAALTRARIAELARIAPASRVASLEAQAALLEAEHAHANAKIELLVIAGRVPQ